MLPQGFIYSCDLSQVKPWLELLQRQGCLLSVLPFLLRRGMSKLHTAVMSETSKITLSCRSCGGDFHPLSLCLNKGAGFVPSAS